MLVLEQLSSMPLNRAQTHFLPAPFGPRRWTGRLKEQSRSSFEHLTHFSRGPILPEASMGDPIVGLIPSCRTSPADVEFAFGVGRHRTFLIRHPSHAWRICSCLFGRARSTKLSVPAAFSIGKRASDRFWGSSI